MEPGGEPNIQQMLQQAQRMQEQLINLQRELAEAEIEGTAGGGLVTATVNGQNELVKLVIDPAAIDPGDPQDTAETLADLVVAAIHNAGEEAQRLQETKMGPLTEGLSGLGGGPGGGLPGGLGLPGL
ncbi:YbaB/EbfC family nucleoid-associated protein [Actinoallomurus iriomotensis]|uniref:Nucleoid-associated protein Airi01_098040 n=1 Tax=Actinoallomurus iriomotensis TaxID=478107 RepID=A0A9W6RWQ4_9ACTN|nr:YbaB/EbfC family nucleoid-associated protein [Actinoallomurus iriomotensis]GLY81537.1 nucleoid-associated protein [Actinoallomurus iriomotensis]GLY87803.1 nucleoid-associated protein [Actinoallomurus iriomotensis]